MKQKIVSYFLNTFLVCDVIDESGRNEGVTGYNYGQLGIYYICLRSL